MDMWPEYTVDELTKIITVMQDWDTKQYNDAFKPLNRLARVAVLTGALASVCNLKRIDPRLHWSNINSLQRGINKLTRDYFHQGGGMGYIARVSESIDPLTAIISEKPLRTGFNQEELVYGMLKYRADPNGYKGYIPLAKAVETQNLEILKHLLKHKADPNFNNGRSALFSAVQMQNVKMINLLLKHKADPNKGYTFNPLIAAIDTENLEIIDLLLQYNADPNRGQHIRSPLVAAIETENLNAIDLLLKHKADPKGDFVLSAAVETGNAEIVKKLLKSGADPDKQSYWFKLSALNVAISIGATHIAELLLNYNADISGIYDKEGDSIGNAIFTDQVEIVKLLLEHGADPKVAKIGENFDDDCPLALEVAKHKPEMMELIERHKSGLLAANSVAVKTKDLHFGGGKDFKCPRCKTSMSKNKRNLCVHLGRLHCPMGVTYKLTGTSLVCTYHCKKKKARSRGKKRGGGGRRS